MIRYFPVALTFLGLSTGGCTPLETVESDTLACAKATARVAELRRSPVAHIASCEAGMQGDVPGYRVVSLRGHCREEVCGSTLIGWFAVRQTDGAVFEFNVGEWKVGPPASGRTFGQ